jgi:crotonobetainyl-CoA:carnitine CoA-transferase CaiB-like acyl-CoA transferase
MFILGDAVLNYTSTGEIMQRHGNASGAASPRGIYEAADGGWLSIAASNQSIALRLFDAMGRPELRDDERYATNTARMANNESMQQIVIDWVKSYPRDEALAILDAHEVVAAAVNDARDVTQDPHFRERTLVDLANTVLGPALVPGPVLHVHDYEGPTYDGVPSVGEHTREVLVSELGMDEDGYSSLVDRGVVSGG